MQYALNVVRKMMRTYVKIPSARVPMMLLQSQSAKRLKL